MNGFTLGLLAAADQTTALRALEFDWPTRPWQWGLFLGGLAVLLALAVWTYLRDTRELSPFWRGWLTVLRLAVIAGLIVIALNPQERTQKSAFRDSRVAILVDTSLSMRHPESAPATGTQLPGAPSGRSRAQAIEELLSKPDLISELRRQHEVSVYTFDSRLAGPHRVFPKEGDKGIQPTVNRQDASAADTPPNWTEWLEPRGLETRLGESLSDLIRQINGRTLSGIVVLSDGASNAGYDISAAHDRALASRPVTRLVTVGVGTTEEPINLQVADLQSPTDVQKGDAFELTAFIRGQRLAGQEVNVELLMLPEGETGEPSLIEQQAVTLLEDGIPVEVKFARNPSEAGSVQYTVRARTTARVPEFNDQDNAQSVTVNVFDRPLRVLLLAGGPMREYRFVTGMLHRHPSLKVDVLLQTADIGTSQDADQILFEFPKNREELFEYDAIIAFDPDWQKIPADRLALLTDWVGDESGGLIFVAGDIYTAQLGSGGGPAGSPTDALSGLRELCPVLLSPYLIDLRLGREDRRNPQPWPIQFTPEGQNAGFLQVTDDPVSSAQVWKSFPGVFACAPTNGQKAGATVYAHFSDPRSQNEHGFPILLASQFYGKGRTFWLGSAELWRLRALEEDYYDRLWIKMIREAAQGRMKRGTRRATLMPESRKVVLGQTVRIPARILDASYQPLQAESVPLTVVAPNGRPLVPDRVLRRDENRPGEFVGDFRASLPGTYQLRLAVPPDGREVVTEEVTVVVPRLEDENIRQDVKALTQLADGTGGAYLTLDEAAAKIPSLLPNRGEPFTVDERLRTLWDRQWVMFLLVGLLSVEWLTRKLLKLA